MKTIKQWLLAVVMLLCSMVAMAQGTATVNGITYEVDATEQTATVVASNGVEYIGDIVIPEMVEYDGVVYSVTTIGDYAFRNCTGLTSITIPNSVTTIGNRAFDACTGLTSVTIPNSVTAIGNYAFRNCTGLTSITIGNSVTTIGRGAFVGCTGLTSVTIPNSVTTIGEGMFGVCTGLTSVTIPNSVTTIGDFAFSSCTGLTSVTIGNSVTTIGGGAFEGCTGLTSVSIPNSVTTIVNRAFEGCTGLESIVIGEGVKTINYYAFANCENLADVFCLATNVPTTESDVFENFYMERATLYVPEESIDSYKSTAPWSGFGTIKAITNEVVTTNGITYELNIIEKTATMVASNGDEYIGDIVIPEMVEYDGVAYSVTTIGSWAFSGCTGLTSVTIPISVTTIGDFAFSNCHGLTSITIPNSVTTLRPYAFSNCHGLTSIAIPNSVTTIGVCAFEDCSSLTAVHISDLSAWCNIDLGHYSSNPLEYAHKLYLNGNLITDLVIPGDITEIKDYAFRGCNGLTSISIPNSVTTIGFYAFYECTGLTSITIPNSVITIGNYAFSGCSGLTNVSIPNSVITIGNYAFEYCIGLESIVVESGNTKYDSREGCNAIIETATNTLIAGCKNTVIPNSVTTIGQEAFRGCNGLTSISIPNSVTTIGDYAFEGCTDLTSVTIPNSVTTIEYYAFENCIGLESIVIGESVKTINSYAFANCENLTNVYCLATSVPTTESNTFNNTNVASAMLYVPEESIDSYKSTAPWSGFGTIKAITNEVVTTNGINYELNIIEKTATVIKSENHSYYGNIVIPETVEYDGVVCNVTAIGNGAFYDCRDLTSITIPNSVITIGELAFEYCTGLTAVHISDLSAWCNIDFDDYSSNPLRYAHNLYLNGNLITDLVIPGDITEIKDYAFYWCSSLTNVTIGNSVTTIGYRAFEYCTGLTSVTIGNSVTTIGYRAFYGCDGLTSITIPNSVTTIGHYAFKLCYNLTSVTIGNSVTTIGNNAFDACIGLTSIVVESGNTKYDSREGCNAIIETATNTLIVGCKNTVIPNNVITIGNYAFDDCIGLESITIPNSVTTIGNYAFSYCTDLTSVTIPNSVTTIEEWAFWGCSGLTSVTIPNSVKTIGDYAFNYCIGLENIYLKADVPPAVGDNNFTTTQYENVVLYVPKGTLAVYQAAYGWKEFKNIQEFDTTDIEDIVTDEPHNGAPDIYYNLRGQAVEHPSRGIYICNGKKVFVK